MASKSKKSSARINSKTTLAKAVELIASNQLRDTTKKPVRIYYKVDPDGTRILLRIAGQSFEQGWQVLMGCDAMSLYGSQIPLAYNGFCAGNQAVFASFAANRNEDMTRWLDNQKEERES